MKLQLNMVLSKDQLEKKRVDIEKVSFVHYPSFFYASPIVGTKLQKNL